MRCQLSPSSRRSLACVLHVPPLYSEASQTQISAWEELEIDRVCSIETDIAWKSPCCGSWSLDVVLEIKSSGSLARKYPCQHSGAFSSSNDNTSRTSEDQHHIHNAPPTIATPLTGGARFNCTLKSLGYINSMFERSVCRAGRQASSLRPTCFTRPARSSEQGERRTGKEIGCEEVWRSALPSPLPRYIGISV